jgi:hypothetical protein
MQALPVGKIIEIKERQLENKKIPTIQTFFVILINS